MADQGKIAVSVVWFKTTDLRTHDHEPLSAAHLAGFPVLHLFVLDPRWFRPTPLMGFPRTGLARAGFQLECLQDLAGRLEAEGHELCVRRGGTAAVFEELCAQFEVKGVYAGREVCAEELRVEDQVRQALSRAKAGPLKLFWMYELHRHDDLPEDVRRKGAAGFSGYRRCFAERCTAAAPLPRPELRKTAPGIRWAMDEGLPSCAGEMPGMREVQPAAEGAPAAWKGGETAALARVEHYFFQADSIALDFTGATNFPHEGHSCTSEGSMTKLSPWLAHGCISARYLFAELRRYERERRKTACTARLVHELYFRDFVRFSSLQKGAKIFKLDGIYGRHPPGGWLQDKEEVLESWRLGRTGFPFLDASMRELLATGHCCHAGREVAGWFLVCDLGLDWRLGAEWFESTLVDYEPASNWFNWAFTCVPRATGGNAIQEEAKPLQPPRTRLQTLEVVYWAAQSDPDAEYIKKWVPELRDLPAALAREPWRAGGGEAAVAERDRRSPEEQPPPVARERDRIGWARRTFPAGGSAVAVWWSCAREGAAAPARASRPSRSARQAAAPQRRLDPEDGKEYTLEQLRARYRKRYSQAEVGEYWSASCEPVAARVDPEDGKERTLSDMLAKYGKRYSREEVVRYFEKDCRPLPEAAGAAGSEPAAAQPSPGEVPAAATWPEGYPLPLMPPASFFCIEEIADHSRRSQRRKAEQSARQRAAWAASAPAAARPAAAGAAPATGCPEAQERRRGKRWAR